ncbi:hypothetical protein ACSBR2_029284 [Camellia fascicularis]
MMSQVKDCLSCLYEHYVAQDSSNVEVPNTSEAIAMSIDDDCDDPHLFISSQFNSYLNAEYSILLFNSYLDDFFSGASDDKLDILESPFSMGRRILDPFRNSISPMMVDVLVCLQNWLKSNVSISFCKAMDDVE